jgi:hypothetical protein
VIRDPCLQVAFGRTIGETLDSSMHSPEPTENLLNAWD